MRTKEELGQMADKAFGVVICLSSDDLYRTVKERRDAVSQMLYNTGLEDAASELEFAAGCPAYSSDKDILKRFADHIRSLK